MSRGSIADKARKALAAASDVYVKAHPRTWARRLQARWRMAHPSTRMSPRGTDSYFIRFSYFRNVQAMKPGYNLMVTW